MIFVFPQMFNQIYYRSTLHSTPKGLYRGEMLYMLQGTIEARTHMLNNIKVGRCVYTECLKTHPQNENLRRLQTSKY